MGCLCSSGGCGPSPKCGATSAIKGPKWSTNYIAYAILNANRAASLVVHDICAGELEHQYIADMIIRRAKNEGRTVSVVDGCLYLDYKFAGVLPIPLPTPTQGVQGGHQQPRSQR